MKSFGRRQAYESPRGTNPRATVEGYGDFNLRLMSARARPQPGSLVVHADRPLRCASARCCRPGSPLAAPLSATMITTDACGSVAGGATPAVEVLTIPCHEAVSRFVAVASGGPRGCLQRSNISLTIIRPPQQEHSGRKSSGSPGVPSSTGRATSSSSRASARLILRAEQRRAGRNAGYDGSHAARHGA